MLPLAGDRTPKDVGRWLNQAEVSKVGECAVDRGDLLLRNCASPDAIRAPVVVCARSCLNETESVLEYRLNDLESSYENE